jgi:hypothetical protein
MKWNKEFGFLGSKNTKTKYYFVWAKSKAKKGFNLYFSILKIF